MYIVISFSLDDLSDTESSFGHEAFAVLEQIVIIVEILQLVFPIFD